MNKKLPVVLSAFVLLSALSVSSAYAAPACPDNRGVIVTDATETDYVDPDQMILTVSIETQAKNAKEAMDKNTEKASAVVKALKAKVNENEVSTSNISVYPVYNYKNKVNSLEYYRAQNEITVKTNKINIGGELISAALANGANRVTGINFALKDKSPYCSASMQKSIETAKAKADLIAKTLGIQIAGVKRVTSNCSSNNYSAYNGVRMLKASAASMDAAGEASSVEVPVEIKKIPMTSTTSIEFFVK
mgnify:CR=1 FL=1